MSYNQFQFFLHFSREPAILYIKYFHSNISEVNPALVFPQNTNIFMKKSLSHENFHYYF